LPPATPIQLSVIDAATHAVFADDNHVQVEAPLGVYPRMIAAYCEPYTTCGRELMVKVITSLSHGVP
jgi:hypothetical protein